MKLSRIIIGVLFAVLIWTALLPSGFVIAAPSITLSPTTGVPGTKAILNGTSFNSYIDDQLAVYFDEANITDTKVTVSSAGVLQNVFTVPDGISTGVHVVSVRGKSGAVLAENTFNVLVPSISLDKWGGVVGAMVNAFCRGFHAGQEIVIQYKSSGAVVSIATGKANNTGECSIQFSVPASSMGSLKITATNGYGNTAETQYEVVPAVSVKPSNGAVGDTIAVTGKGFVPGSAIAVILYGKNVAYAGVESNGSFNTTFHVPAIRAGMYAIEIDEGSTLGNLWVDFMVEPRITPSKTSGEVGTKLTITGTSFEVEGEVSIKFDDEEILSVAADNEGSFSFSFNVPPSIAGEHKVTATDGFNTMQVIFTIESEPPPTPKTLVPKNGSQVIAQTSFDWESVYDPSEPVSYTLEIARNIDFSSLVLAKNDLLASQYSLSKEEALLPNRRFTHYYWRVRATDRAANVGQWSDAVAFQVKPHDTLVDWGKYLMGAFGLLLVAMLILRIRKNLAELKHIKKQ